MLPQCDSISVQRASSIPERWERNASFLPGSLAEDELVVRIRAKTAQDKKSGKMLINVNCAKKYAPEKRQAGWRGLYSPNPACLHFSDQGDGKTRGVTISFIIKHRGPKAAAMMYHFSAVDILSSAVTICMD